jgi:hypothetical protein
MRPSSCSAPPSVLPLQPFPPFAVRPHGRPSGLTLCFLLRGATVTKEDVVTAANLQKFVDYFGPFDCPAMISRVSSLSS